MELLKRDHWFSMFSRKGLHVGLKFYFFKPMRSLNLVVLKYILNKITIKMCNCYL
jgi:hypothetical protein